MLLNQLIEGHFVAVQPPEVRELLKSCKVSYDALSVKMLIECPDRYIAEIVSAHPALAQQMRGLGCSLKVEAPEYSHTIGEPFFMSTTTNAINNGLSYDDAKQILLNSPHPAGICRFRQHGLLILDFNRAMPDFVGVPADRIRTDNVAVLFLEPEYLDSLIQLETTLEQHGKVANFPLRSKRTNGDEGEYIVNAWKINDYEGLPARLTEYIRFESLRA